MTERVGMPRSKARFRRVVAALLALALLVLPGAPMRHASAAPLHAQPAAHSHVQDCVGHGDGVASHQAIAGHHGDGGQPDRHPGDQPGPGCCGSAQCPATVAVPAVAPAQPAAPSGARADGHAPPPAPDGVGVDPPIHPPRALA